MGYNYQANQNAHYLCKTYPSYAQITFGYDENDYFVREGHRPPSQERYMPLWNML